MKKLSMIVLFVFVSLFLILSCTKSNESANAKTVTVWAWDPNFNIAVMNEAAKRYNSKNPDVKINVVDMAKADLEQKLHTVLASKTTAGLPEIVLIEDYNAQKYLHSYPGAFAEIGTTINPADFADYKKQILSMNGKLYGLPFDSGVSGLFYRTDILEKAGFKPADLQNITWDRFIEIGKAVKAKTGKYMLAFDPTDGGIMRIMLQSAGQWYFDANGKPSIIDNQIIPEAIQTYKKIMDSGIAKQTTGWNEWVGAINNGDAATITTGVWIVGSIKAANEQSGNWSVAPTPRLNAAASKNASNLGGSSWFVLEKSAAKKAALDFLKTVWASDSDFYQTILMNQGAVGTYLPATSGNAYQKQDPFFGNKAIYADLAEWMKNIPSVNYGEYTYEADSAAMAQTSAFIRGAVTMDALLKAVDTQLKAQIQ